MAIDVVVATDINGGIGKNGKMPWHLKKDFAWFKKITSTRHVSEAEAITTFNSLFNKTPPQTSSSTANGTTNNAATTNKNETTPTLLLMGHTTWLSIGAKPLKGRMHGVVTNKNYNAALKNARQKNYEGIGKNKVKFFSSIEEAFNFANQNFSSSFAIGGESFYNYTLKNKLFRAIYITKILNSYKCDKFFFLPEAKLKTISLGCFIENNIKAEVCRITAL